MPTILELVANGELEKYDPALDEDEQEERSIYFLKGGLEKAEMLLSKMESQWDIETSPAEQLDEIFYHFTTGGSLDYPRQFHELRHRGNGLWELRTPDLRIFGFFPKKDCFICTDVADKNWIVKNGAYAGYINQGVFRRENLDLDPPKFIEGTEPEDVVSNCYRSKS